ncbi:MAG: PilZ domain-containing protein, partial [Myxococcota bacterium]|nr:PilZ domain-containing protein [Myxococcota bacterium]
MIVDSDHEGLMSEHQLPTEDQLVTMVSVRDGNIHVTSARVMVSKPKSLGLRVDTSLSEVAPFERAQPLTLLYASNDRVMRLKAVVRSPIDDERLTVQPVGDVKEGDRRDFRRANILVGTYARPTSAQTAAEARAEQLDLVAADDQYFEQMINLSGSGIQISSKVDWASGTLLDIRLRLPLPKPSPVCVIGEV